MGSKKEKTRGPTSDSEALRTRSMDEIMGIEAIDFGLGDLLTPKPSLNHLRQQSDIRHAFNEWLQSIHDSVGKCNQSGAPTQFGNPLPILQQYDNIDVNKDVQVNKIDYEDDVVEENVNKNEIEPIHIELEDI